MTGKEDQQLIVLQIALFRVIANLGEYFTFGGVFDYLDLETIAFAEFRPDGLGIVNRIGQITPFIIFIGTKYKGVVLPAL